MSKDAVTVKPEATPNPATMKFVFSEAVAPEGGFEFSNAFDAERSPLAAKIFGFPWTLSVYLGSDFISVTKADWVEWDVLAEPLANLISEHLEMNEPVLMNPSEAPAEADEDNPDDPEIVRNIKQVLRRDIRPVVALDGGDIVFDRFEEGVVYLQMKGACVGCPSSQATLKEGIETRLKEIFPEVKEVLAV